MDVITNLKNHFMKDLKPYAYLYKHIEEPTTLKSSIITQIPAKKTLTLRAGDPTTSGSITVIRYIVENDSSQLKSRMEQFENKFDWDGTPHNVEVIIGSGSGDEGGKTVLGSDYAELD